jgi:hypothetical protein
MTAGEYVAAFASIIVALAVTDLATSLHRLLRARARVTWDWLPLAVALLILLGTVQFWWIFFDVWRSSSQFTLGGFLPDFVSLLILFFIASAALPDEVPAEGLDLKSYYLENRTYFWVLFLLLAVSATASPIFRRASPETTAADVAVWILESGNLTLVVIAAVLIATGRRWVHAALVLVMLAALAWPWVALTIAG